MITDRILENDKLLDGSLENVLVHMCVFAVMSQLSWLTSP